MHKTTLIRLLTYLISATETLLGLALVLLWHLANTKMGVMRHVVFKNAMLSHNPNAMVLAFMASGLLIVLALLNIAVWLKASKSTTLALLLSAVLLFTFAFTLLKFGPNSLSCYYYLYVVAWWVAVLEGVKVGVGWIVLKCSVKKGIQP